VLRACVPAWAGEGVSRTGEEFAGLARQRSSWLIPLGVFFVTACLSAVVFAYYFAPGRPGLGAELPDPTDATRPLALSIGETRFRVPANYVLLASARKGGELEQLGLVAMLPDFRGYSMDAAEEFSANGANSSAVMLTLKLAATPILEQDRLDRIYLMQVLDSAGQAGLFGLKQYAFRPESGYHSEDLFVGSTQAGPVVLLCDRPDADTPSPNCMRDTSLSGELALSYRFKRARLAEWQSIDAGVRKLLSGFVVKN